MVELPGALEASPRGILLTPHFLGPPPSGRGPFRRPPPPGGRQQPRLLRRRPPVRCPPSTGGGRTSAPNASTTRWPASSSTRSGWTSALALPGGQLPPRRLQRQRRQPVGASARARRRRLPDRLDRRAAPPVPLPRLRLERAREAVGPRAQDSYAHLVAGRQRAPAAVQGVRRRPVALRGAAPAGPAVPVCDGHPGQARSRASSAAPTAGSARRAPCPLPSPFEPSEAAAYERWRRRAWLAIGRGLLHEGAKCVRIVLPEEYDHIKKRFPRLAGRLQDRFGGGSGSWG